MGDRVGSLFADPTQGSEVRQAILDMFLEKESAASRWLTEICSVYVMMCSLGFEALSSMEVTGVLRNFHLVADSDVMLSLLCGGEDNHEDVNRLVRVWKALGGKFLMATPVLEEVAYHAWISEPDYNAMHDQLHTISDIDAKRLMEMRSFAHFGN